MAATAWNYLFLMILSLDISMFAFKIGVFYLYVNAVILRGLV